MSKNNTVIKEVIVVEGKNDTHRLREIFGDGVDTIETLGYALTDETVELIREASKRRGVIVLTDPDGAGKRIRARVAQLVPDVRHAYITFEDGVCEKKNKVGIEHAPLLRIKDALQNVSSGEVTSSDVTYNDLLRLGLVGFNSWEKRLFVAKKLKIGSPNGKQLLKRIKMFNIRLKKIITILESDEVN